MGQEEQEEGQEERQVVLRQGPVRAEIHPYGCFSLVGLSGKTLVGVGAIIVRLSTHHTQNSGSWRRKMVEQ